MNSKEAYYWVLYFFILLFLSGLVHHFYKKSPPTVTADGSIVMAIGIGSLVALQKVFFVTKELTQFIALELLIIWLYLISRYIKLYLDGHFNQITASKLGQFGIGTWVAGSSVLALLFLHTFPKLSIVIWTSTFLALLTWVIYLIMSSYNLWFIVFKQLRLHTGIILLPTVSTQSIVLLSYALFATELPLLMYQALIILGYLLYLIGLFVIVKHTLIHRHKPCIIGWDNTNSIIHGALSISGLASVSTLALSDSIVISTWFLATMFLILNEGISLIKGIYRLKLAGLNQGIFVYHSSQWARIFTLGMYYAFNSALLEQHHYTNLFIEQIVRYGQYGVLIIILFELVNYFYNQFE